MMEQSMHTREEIYELVWKEPMWTLAKKFGLSDVGLAKVCKRFAIPKPDRGYWQQLAAGKAPKRPLLPPTPSGVGEVITFNKAEQSTLSKDPNGRHPEVMAWIERESRPENRITAPDAVVRYHSLVQATRDSLAGRRDYGQAPCWAGKTTFSLKVSRPTLPRACRLLHALVTAIVARGFTIMPRDEVRLGTPVHLLGEEVTIEIEERTDRHPRVNAETKMKSIGPALSRGVPKYDYTGNGQLRLKVEAYWTREYFRDHTDQLLEEQLNAVIIALVRLAIEVHRPRRLEREEEERQRLEQQRKYELFVKRRNLFEGAFKSWHEQQVRLRFIEDIERKIAGDSSEGRDRLVRFLSWARGYVGNSDPIGCLLASVVDGANPNFYVFEQDAHSRYRY